MSRVGLVAIVGALLIGVVWFGARQSDPQPTTTPAGSAGWAEPAAVYDPWHAGESMPSGYRQVLGRDVIRPVYDPTFVPAAEAGWDDDLLVIGVEVDGDARAYPVGFLNRREMVIDEIGGEPVLVTW
jgi:hypothetical protein